MEQSRSNVAEPTEQIQPRQEKQDPTFKHLKLSPDMDDDATPGNEASSHIENSVAQERNEKSDEQMRTASPVKPEPGTTRYSQMYDPNNRRRAAYFGMAEHSSTVVNVASPEGQANENSQP